MQYNFDTKVDRSGTNSTKLYGYKQYKFQDKDIDLDFDDEDFIHFWIADMEFACAPEIIDAIKDRLDRKILGYTDNYDDKLYDALSSWTKERYDFSFDKKELVLSNGVVPAIARIIRYLVGDDEKVLFTKQSKLVNAWEVSILRGHVNNSDNIIYEIQEDVSTTLDTREVKENIVFYEVLERHSSFFWPLFLRNKSHYTICLSDKQWPNMRATLLRNKPVRL